VIVKMGLLGAVALTFCCGNPAPARDVAVHAGLLIDGSGQAPLTRQTILIRDDRIISVNPGFQSPPDAEIIDLSGETVMPGFIDCHIHIGAKLPGATNATEYWLTHSSLDRAFDGAVFARAMLQQGFTTGRDVGGGDETTALRDAINEGKLPGPRLFVSLEPLGPTAGHGDPYAGLDPHLSDPDWQRGLVDSPEQARLRVREHKRRGADLIKIMPSGGIASTGDDPRQQLMTNDEMRVAVETAHALGMKVAAHIYPAGAIENAVLAGVDSVEHGSFATAQTFALMKSHGTVLVPTLTVYEVFYLTARDHPELLTPGTPAKELANDPLPKRNLPLALKSGVTIAYGTDIGEGDHAMEFALLIANGMSPMDAIRAATGTAAQLLGAADRIGLVQPGHFADLVAVSGNPLTDTALFGKIDFVMKAGTLYRQGGKSSLAN
jgi:imidazolonepropionase-like amidohydrolase